MSSRLLLLETELAQKVNIRVYTDSTAGKSMSTRFGTSKKTRHVQLRFLYIQELVLQGVLQVKKVLGTSNPTDVMTKYVSKNTSETSQCFRSELPFWPSGLTSLLLPDRDVSQVLLHEIRLHELCMCLLTSLFSPTLPNKCLSSFGV